MTKDEIRTIIVFSEVGKRLYTDHETVDPCSLTPREVDEIVEKIYAAHVKDRESWLNHG